MTNIDLGNIIMKNGDVAANRMLKKNKAETVRKRLIQLIVIITFLLFGVVAFLSMMPHKEVDCLTDAWNKVFNRDSTASIYVDKLEKCKFTRKFEDCCTIVSQFDDKGMVHDCTVEGVIDTILRRGQNVLFSSLIKETTNLPPDSNFIEIKNIEEADYNYHDSNYYHDVDDYSQKEAEEVHEESTTHNYEHAVIESKVTIEGMTSPTIQGGNVAFQTHNMHVKLSNAIPWVLFHRAKRQYQQYNAPQYYQGDYSQYSPQQNIRDDRFLDSSYGPTYNEQFQEIPNAPSNFKPQTAYREHFSAPSYPPNYLERAHEMKYQFTGSRVADLHDRNIQLTVPNDNKLQAQTSNKKVYVEDKPSEYISKLLPTVSSTKSTNMVTTSTSKQDIFNNVDTIEYSQQIKVDNNETRQVNNKLRSYNELQLDSLLQAAPNNRESTSKEHIATYEEDTVFTTSNSLDNMDKDQKLRVNIGQKQFRANNKLSQFPSATEDLKSSQYSAINPAFSQKQCIATYMPPLNSPYPIMQQQVPYSYGANPRYAQFVPVTRGPVNSYVINPQYTYLNPSYQQLIPNLNQAVPASYNPYYGTQHFPSADPIQVEGPGGQFYVCNPIPSPSNQASIVPGVEVRQNIDSLNLEELLDQSMELDDLNNKTRASPKCPLNERSCADDKKCIRKHQICDGETNCDDASDEVFCSCKKRVGPARLCDGYFDCPNGDDELGCFGCDEDTFNCDDWSEDRGATCILLEERCDGIAQCPTGRDEEDCSILTNKVEEHLQQYKVSNTMGFLHRNYKGKWYPACSNPEIWAIEACEIEAGPSNLPPLTHMIPTKSVYDGKYINALSGDDIEIVESCVFGRAVYVECPQPTCGIRRLVKNFFRSDEVDTSAEEILSTFLGERNVSNSQILGESRVVGGRPSQPAAWPWVVSVYRNGVFHCGGALISPQWIVTAAHCVDKFQQYYYEVEAGILRRFSYAPMQQNRYVSHVVSHNGYDRANLKNDLALMKLSSPFKYNRYVRPICLPTEITAGQSYLNGPLPGTTCTAVGWGATVEHGADPDNLREVEVPILSHCKHKEDEEGNDICAGLQDGGKDACQGDSGGPFMCRNPNIPNQWYLAGIVSHGEGCARPNEPGVYTRVSLYRNWIYENARNDVLPKKKPLDKCPGYTCKATNKCVPKRRRCDRVVDCLLGDDESHCHKNNIGHLFKHAMRHMILLGSTKNSTQIDQAETTNPTETTLPAGADSSTLITNEEVAPEATSNSDSIFGSTFEMESTPASDNSNRNGFGSTGDGDTSFATSPSVSDQSMFITNTEFAINSTGVTFFNSETTETLNNYTITSTISSLPRNSQSMSIMQTQKSEVVNLKYFVCQIMLEVIPLSKKCNKIVDCQDATDEKNCTCLDYLRTFYPEAVCDGITDCSDFTDEKDCGSCKTDEFRCKMTNTCIAADNKCDNVPNCPFNEDEWDCFALTDGYALLLDEDLRPHLNTKGILSFSYKGGWRPMCGNWTNSKSTIASSACLALGFSDYIKYLELPVSNRSLDVRIQGFNSSINNKVAKVKNNCNALYVKCSNITITAHEIGNEDKYNVANELYTTPWNAAIYADGEYKCTGTLLNLNWVLTSINCFPGILKLRHHYVTVLLGSRKAYLYIAGPHEQIKLVVQSHAVLYSDVVLLRLNTNVILSRYVRPIHFIKQNKVVRSKEICIASGKNVNEKFQEIFLKPVANCTAGSRCFKRISANNEKCQNSDLKSPWSGCIVCDSGNGFYPAAVFSEIQGSCGFSRTSSYTSVSLLKSKIFGMMEETAFVVETQECKGFRCALGQCIESERICDGIPDCRDGADEEEKYCRNRNYTCHLADTCVCLKSDMRCANGKCFPKSAFCDTINDCGDDSDEPDICTCRAYLQLTDPRKLCDGVRNCHDRSDEDPKICKCASGKFKCGSTGLCIPNEMVCDGRADCPGKQDEEQCLSLRLTSDSEHAGEVMTRTAGVWHSSCFPEHLSTFDLENICKRLGFTANSATSYRNGSESSGFAMFDPFNVVWVHRKFGGVKIAMRSGNVPLVTFKNDKSCYKLFIQCL